MTYTILLETTAEQTYQATLLGWPDVQAIGKSETEVTERVKMLLQSRLAQGKLIQIELDNNVVLLKASIIDQLDGLSGEQLQQVKNYVAALSHGDQPAAVEPEPSEHPWMQFAGMFADDPDWDEYLDCLAEARRELNQIEAYDDNEVLDAPIHS